MTEISLGQVSAEALTLSDQIEDDLEFACVVQFVRAVAADLQLDEREIFDTLIGVPNSMLYMLESPEGWTSLVAVVTAENEHSASSYHPTRH